MLIFYWIEKYIYIHHEYYNKRTNKHKQKYSKMTISQLNLRFIFEAAVFVTFFSAFSSFQFFRSIFLHMFTHGNQIEPIYFYFVAINLDPGNENAKKKMLSQLKIELH